MTLAITIPRGTTHDIIVTVTGKDLTGATAACTFVTAHGTTPTLTKKSTVSNQITIVGATNSTVTVHLLPADGLDLTSSPYYFQILVKLGAVQEIIEEGVLTLTPNDVYGVTI